MNVLIVILTGGEVRSQERLSALSGVRPKAASAPALSVLACRESLLCDITCLGGQRLHTCLSKCLGG